VATLPRPFAKTRSKPRHFDRPDHGGRDRVRSGPGNVIPFNGRDGVEVTSGNGNAILGNSIHDSSLVGIGLNTANGANDKQAARVLTGVTGSAASPAISGTLTSVANTTFRIEFFANPTPGSLANTEGQTLLGATYVTTNASDVATFTASGLAAIPAAQGYLTATATVATPAGSGYTYGDTSQFSSYLHVAYSFGGFQPPLSQGLNFALNRVIPIKFALTDLTGASVTSLAAVSSLQVAPVNADGSLGTPFMPATPGNTSLSVNGSTYALNWQTKGLAAGSYAILLTLADGTVYSKVVHLTANGNGANAQAADGSDVSGGDMANQLLGGNVALYVDNSNGDLTPDELARIQDAVTAIDAVIAPYGVAVAEVTDPSQADVTLNMNTTSPVGGYASGILGCFDPTAEQITLIAGWSWYAGADATQVGAGQYDFQTTVTHELGHALGLGESSNSASAMYATLAPGTAIRALTTADLNVPYDDSGPDPQRAAVVPGPVGPAAFGGFGKPVTVSPLAPPSASLPSAGNDLLFAFLGRGFTPAGSAVVVLDAGKLAPWSASALGQSPPTGAGVAVAADDSSASRPAGTSSDPARKASIEIQHRAVDEVFVRWAEDALAPWTGDPAGL
jgi:hypothetical protein